MDERIVVLDGGFSTQLARYVGDIIDGHPLWSARFLQTHPEAVVKSHLDFLEAGSEIIMTNTYQASIQGFMEHLGCDRQTSYDMIKRAVKLAAQARDQYLKENPDDCRKILIAGSVGPYGAFLHDGSEYTGSYIDNVTKKEIIDWHRPRVAALIEEGVDLLAFETMPALKEAEYVLELLKEYPKTKAWLSFQCKDARHTAKGESFQEAVRKIWNSGKDQLVAVGCNCVNPNYVNELFRGINDDGSGEKIPLIVYPNSGEEYKPDKGCQQEARWFGIKISFSLDTLINEWIDLGVKYVGGCCRMDAADVATIREIVDRRFLAIKQVHI